MMAKTVVSWEDAEPLYAQPPIYVASLKAYLSVGSFVIFKVDEEGEKKKIGRIVRREAKNHVLSLQQETLVMNIFLHLSDMPFATQVMRETAGEAAGVVEVVQTFEQITVSAASISNVSFVFSAKRMHATNVVCAGIDNCFYCRFRSDQTQIGNLVTFPSHHPDHHHIVICYPLRIWNAIEQLRDSIAKLLNRTGEKQGAEHCRHYVRLIFPPEGWYYLMYKLGDDSVISRLSISRSLRFRILHGMVGSKKSIERSAELIRFETEDQLTSLRKLLGSTITYGFREKKPRVGTTKRIAENWAVHVISGADTVEDPFVPFTKKEGIDFIYDQIELKVVLRYHKYLFTTQHSTLQTETHHMIPPMHGVICVNVSHITTSCTYADTKIVL
jgi:hypothetical protein